MGRLAQALDGPGHRGMQGNAQALGYLADDIALADLILGLDRRGARRADVLAQNDFKFIGDRHDLDGEVSGQLLGCGRMNTTFGEGQ